jgi:hypothetical protein
LQNLTIATSTAKAGCLGWIFLVLVTKGNEGGGKGIGMVHAIACHSGRFGKCRVLTMERLRHRIAASLLGVEALGFLLCEI